MIATSYGLTGDYDSTYSASNDNASSDTQIIFEVFSYYNTHIDDPWVSIQETVKKLKSQSEYPHIIKEYNEKIYIKLRNIYPSLPIFYYRRTLFSKSGFIGRVAKRRKN